MHGFYSCFSVTSFSLFCCSEHHIHAYVDTEHSGKHRYPLLKPGQKHRVVGGLTGGQGPQEVFGESKAHPQARAGCSHGSLYRCMHVHTFQALGSKTRVHNKR